AGVLVTNATPVFLDNETRFYYGAHSYWDCEIDDGIPLTGIGLASMPRDRFASIRPIESVGQITLKPIELSLCHGITINADASGGAIRVELLNENGHRLRGYAKEDAVVIDTDSLDHPVQWREKKIADLPPGRFLIRLHLHNAEVSALTVIHDESK
ncbi:unnamed protein product, partial [marine sediment metagenome]